MAANIIDLLMAMLNGRVRCCSVSAMSGVFDMPNYPVPIAAGRLPPEQLKKTAGGIEHKGLHIWYAGHATSNFDAVLTVGLTSQGSGSTAPATSWQRFADSHKKVAGSIDELDFIVHMTCIRHRSQPMPISVCRRLNGWETDMIVETCNTWLPARPARTCGNLG